MFIATMYSYGWDANIVGVDGIVTCMGVFYASPTNLYAIHIPDNSEAVNKKGADAFVKFVKGAAENKTPDGKLYGVVNGTPRAHAMAEMKYLREQLGLKAGPKRMLYRLKNINEAAAVVCEYGPNKDKDGPILLCRTHASANWKTDHENAKGRSDFYHNQSFDTKLGKKEVGVHKGWTLVNATSADLLQIE